MWCYEPSAFARFLEIVEYGQEQIWKINDVMFLIASLSGSKLYVWNGVEFCIGGIGI